MTSKKVMNERDNLLRKSRKSNVRGIKDEYRRKHNQVNSMIRTTKSNYARIQLEENAHDPTKFWNTIKNISVEVFSYELKNYNKFEYYIKRLL